MHLSCETVWHWLDVDKTTAKSCEYSDQQENITHIMRDSACLTSRSLSGVLR